MAINSSQKFWLQNHRVFYANLSSKPFSSGVNFSKAWLKLILKPALQTFLLFILTWAALQLIQGILISGYIYLSGFNEDYLSTDIYAPAIENIPQSRYEQLHLFLTLAIPFFISLLCFAEAHSPIISHRRKAVLFWFTYHGLNLLLGKIIIDLLCSSGSFAFFEWIGFGDTGKLLLIEFSLFGLFLSGFLFYSPLTDNINRQLPYQSGDKFQQSLFLSFIIPISAGAIAVGVATYLIYRELPWIALSYIPSILILNFRIRSFKRGKSKLFLLNQFYESIHHN